MVDRERKPKVFLHEIEDLRIGEFNIRRERKFKYLYNVLSVAHLKTEFRRGSKTVELNKNIEKQ